ncbi:MAG: cytochrome C [Albidovulum sp.]|nr:cytochrome C [Albidovulum sp.]
MRILYATAAFLAALSLSALAEGDADKGANTFKKCKACHAIVADDGTTIVRGGRVGPNLYGVVGRRAASVEEFKYGKGLIEAGENGLVWDKKNFIEYLKNPPRFVAAYIGVPKVVARMAFRLSKGGEDLYAYLKRVAEDGS